MRGSEEVELTEMSNSGSTNAETGRTFAHRRSRKRSLLTLRMISIMSYCDSSSWLSRRMMGGSLLEDVGNDDKDPMDTASFIR